MTEKTGHPHWILSAPLRTGPRSYRIGPDWATASELVSATARRLRDSLATAEGETIRVLADGPLAAFPEADPIPNLAGFEPDEVICAVNPCYPGMDPEWIHDARSRYRKGGAPVIALRRPWVHPLLFLRRVVNRTRGYGRLDSDSWRHHSSRFEFGGQFFEMRRQHYPPVFEACNAVFVGPVRSYLNVSRALAWNQFEPVTLPDCARYDVSYARERLLYLVLRREAPRADRGESQKAVVPPAQVLRSRAQGVRFPTSPPGPP